ncbi:MAG: methyltransferase domain-containing protein [Thermodesulfobacterium sp.]|nr:methyltransferase domain-containing protein [Thermodesulfobacterium sp.]
MQEIATLERYKRAAKKPEKALCCPVSYQPPELLKIIPQEILEVDYGCGDPTVYVREGEVVVDLGSGSGKHVYMIAQIVGPKGKVIGVDFNKEMLSLARKYQDEIAKKLGYKNTEFYYAKIQNLKLDLEKVEAYLQTNPIKTAEDLIVFENYVKKLEEKEPLIPDESVDTVVSNCVLNLVKPEDKDRLFSEIYRVLKIGGRAVISDIVSDEDVPPHLQEDP